MSTERRTPTSLQRLNPRVHVAGVEPHISAELHVRHMPGTCLLQRPLRRHPQPLRDLLRGQEALAQSGALLFGYRFADRRRVVSAAMTNSYLHSFRLAHPVVRSSTRFELTALAVLSMAAITLWLLVVPLEFALHLTV
jgi:hypothetical protein